MRRLTYISTVVPGVTDGDVEQILATSRRNNGRAGLTGLLLYDGRRFLQALEGAPEQVTAAFERIKSDTRHRALVLLSAREVEARAFGNWAMAAERVSAGQGGHSVVEQVQRLTAGIADALVRDEFRSFAALRSVA